MEFQFRAGDERSRSPPPSTGAAAASASSRSADGDGTGHHGENSALVPRPHPLPPASDPDELRRQAATERIRERILQEEAENLALEAEVRRELMEERMTPLLRSGPMRPTGARAEGSEVGTEPAGMMLDSPSPIVLEVRSNANVSAALPAKRKNPDVAAASAVSAATSNKKKKKKLDLTCTVCGITSTGEKAMREHLEGKGHKRKAAAEVTPLPTPEAERKQEEAAEEQEEENVTAPPEGDYKPTKLTMLTDSGTMYEVLQMDGFILCELCNVRAADRVTMMCHLQGDKHISRAKKKLDQAKKGVEAQSTSAVAVGGHGTVAVEVNGVTHTVRRVGGFLLCECCDVKATSEGTMRTHLSGKKHKNKAAGGKATSAEAIITKDVSLATNAGIPIGLGQEKNPTLDDSESAGVDIGKQQVVQKVDGFLLCVCCNVKATSDCVMRSHLAGKKHKNTAKKAAVHVGEGGNKEVALTEAKSNETSVLAGTGHTQANDAVKGQAPVQEVSDAMAEQAEVVPLATPQQVGAVEEEEHAEPGDLAEIAEEEKPTAPGTQGKEPVKPDVIAMAGQEIKMEVEGAQCVVLRQANDTLSCWLCGAHGFDKNGILDHLYTREHRENVRLDR